MTDMVKNNDQIHGQDISPDDKGETFREWQLQCHKGLRDTADRLASISSDMSRKFAHGNRFYSALSYLGQPKPRSVAGNDG